MQKDTKKFIFDTFIELLGTKSFDKISVKDIVEACDINRNTFYYYYSDIYDLLEEVFMKELNVLLDAHKEGRSWVEAFMKIANVAHAHKKVISNICASRSYDYLENYMYRACKIIVVEIVRDNADGMLVPDEDIEFIASFYEYAYFGIISEWFRTGMKEDPLKLATQIWLVADNMKYALRKSEKRAKNRLENGDSISG